MYAGDCAPWIRGGVLMHNHFQMVVEGNFSSLPVLNQNMQSFIWGEMRILQWVMWFLARGGKDEGLHTFLGMAWCWMKDNREEQFEVVEHDMSDPDMNVR